MVREQKQGLVPLMGQLHQMWKAHQLIVTACIQAGQGCALEILGYHLTHVQIHVTHWVSAGLRQLISQQQYNGQ